MEEVTMIFVIIILLMLVIALGIAVLYLCRILFRVEEKLSDLELSIHFATDHYLLKKHGKKSERNDFSDHGIND